MAISQVVLILFLWAFIIFVSCLLIGHRHSKIENWAVVAETFTLLAALSAGIAISHIFSELNESLSQTSYRSELNSVYETSLNCRQLSPLQYSSAIADSCAVVDAAFRWSFSPMPEHDSKYWQRNINEVVNKLKAIIDRQPPRESPTSTIDKEEIEIAIRSLNIIEQHVPQSISVSWEHRFWEAFITALIVIGTATIKFYVALTRRLPEQMHALTNYVISVTFLRSRPKS